MPTRANAGRRSPQEVFTKNPLGKRGTEEVIVGKNDKKLEYKVLIPSKQVVVTTTHVNNIKTLTAESNKKLRRVPESKEGDELKAFVRERQRERGRVEPSRGDAKTPRVSDTSASTSTRPTSKMQSESKRLKELDRNDVGDLAKTAQRRKVQSTVQDNRAVRTDKTQDDASNDESEVEVLPRKSARARKTSVKQREDDDANASVPSNAPKQRAHTTIAASMLVPLATTTLVAGDENVALPDQRRIERRSNRLMRTCGKWLGNAKEEGRQQGHRALQGWHSAGGDDQVLSHDYNLTLLAVLDITSRKVKLEVSRMWGVPARHYDVPSAYLKAYNEDGVEIYLRVPRGMQLTSEELACVGAQNSGDVCLRLIKSHYGLKQAGRYSESKNVRTCVDDFLAAATSEKLLDDFGIAKKSLELKCLGSAKHFLGMRISYTANAKYAIDQEQTIVELLHDHGMESSNAVRAPIADESSLQSESTSAQLLPPAGSCSAERPTVQWFQSLGDTRQIHAPTENDLKIERQILRYLSGIASLKLTMEGDVTMSNMRVKTGGTLTKNGVRVSCCTDSDYAADIATRKSISGAIVFVGGMPVAWQVKQQSAVALSTAEDEFVAAAVGVKDLLGVRTLLEEVGVQIELPMKALVNK
uniref:Reverse transcriptase Ty1/copia-type domain-containing protein n=1 Tax=Peronospora matthiolae TaxID=2874970 RepID=A0AAV1U6M1_9STRA